MTKLKHAKHSSLINSPNSNHPYSLKRHYSVGDIEDLIRSKLSLQQAAARTEQRRREGARKWNDLEIVGAFGLCTVSDAAGYNLFRRRFGNLPAIPTINKRLSHMKGHSVFRKR